MACACVLVYVGSLLSTLPLPAVVPVAWAVGCLTAWRWPKPSLIAWLACAPLLPIVPALAHWPSLSLPSLWLSALAIPAWIRLAAGPGLPVLPRAAVCWLLIATASLVVVLYPLHAAHDGAAAFLWEIHRYLRQDVLTTTAQRPRLSPILAWAVVAEGMVALWVCLFTFRDPSRHSAAWIRAAAVALAVGAVAVGFWAVWQRWTGRHLLLSWIELDPYIVRVNASFTDVNALGAYLASMLPLIVALALDWRDRRMMLVHVAGALAVVGGLIFTASRAAWGGAALAMAIVAWGVLRWRLVAWGAPTYHKLRRAAALTALIALVALAGLTVSATMGDVRVHEQRNLSDVLLHTLNLRAPVEERFKGRPQLWTAALRMVEARPLTGIGIGRYFKDVYAWAPEQDALIRPQENAHNYFLQVAAETGWPGLIALVVLMGGAAWSALRVVRSGSDPGARRLALGTLAGIVAFSTTLLTGHSLLLREGQLTFWPLIGLALLLARERDADASRVGGLRRLVVPLAAAIFLVTLPVRLLHATPLPLRTSGFFAEEEDSSGTWFQWTGARATIDVPSQARVVTLEARARAPFPQTIQVWIDGRHVDNVPAIAAQWVPLRYVFAAEGSSRRYVRLELRIGPPWRAPDDGRELGVMVRNITWAR
jgi:O-antigen ligase